MYNEREGERKERELSIYKYTFGRYTDNDHNIRKFDFCFQTKQLQFDASVSLDDAERP